MKKYIVAITTTRLVEVEADNWQEAQEQVDLRDNEVVSQVIQDELTIETKVKTIVKFE